MDFGYLIPCIDDMKKRGVEVILYKDPRHLRSDSVPVFDRKAFRKALDLPLDNSNDDPTATFIEITDAFKIWTKQGIPVTESKDEQLDLFSEV